MQSDTDTTILQDPIQNEKEICDLGLANTARVPIQQKSGQANSDIKRRFNPSDDETNTREETINTKTKNKCKSNQAVKLYKDVPATKGICGAIKGSSEG